MPAKKRVGRGLRQLHLWLERSDYAFVKSLARNRDVSVSKFFRSVIGSWRTRADAQSGTKMVPNVADAARISEAGASQGAGSDATYAQTSRSSKH